MGAQRLKANQGLCGVCEVVCNQKPGTRGFPLDRIFIVVVLSARLLSLASSLSLYESTYMTGAYMIGEPH